MCSLSGAMGTCIPSSVPASEAEGGGGVRLFYQIAPRPWPTATTGAGAPWDLKLRKFIFKDEEGESPSLSRPMSYARLLRAAFCQRGWNGHSWTACCPGEEGGTVEGQREKYCSVLSAPEKRFAAPLRDGYQRLSRRGIL